MVAKHRCTSDETSVMEGWEQSTESSIWYGDNKGRWDHSQAHLTLMSWWRREKKILSHFSVPHPPPNSGFLQLLFLFCFFKWNVIILSVVERLQLIQRCSKLVWCRSGTPPPRRPLATSSLMCYWIFLPTSIPEGCICLSCNADSTTLKRVQDRMYLSCSNVFSEMSKFKVVFL